MAPPRGGPIRHSECGVRPGTAMLFGPTLVARGGEVCLRDVDGAHVGPSPFAACPGTRRGASRRLGLACGAKEPERDLLCRLLVRRSQPKFIGTGLQDFGSGDRLEIGCDSLAYQGHLLLTGRFGDG